MSVTELAKLETERAECQEAMDICDEQIIDIKDQIARAHADVVDSRQFSDPDWWRRVNTAARYKARDRQALQRKLGELNRAIRTAHHDIHGHSFERAFISEAREYLSREQYAYLVSHAQMASAKG